MKLPTAKIVMSSANIAVTVLFKVGKSNVNIRKRTSINMLL